MMRASLQTAGVSLNIDCELRWAGDLIAEGAAGELLGADLPDCPAVLHIEAGRRPFDTVGWRLLTRGAWQRDGEVVVADVCTTGFDLHVRIADGRPHFTYRFRPPARSRVAGWALRSRFHLLVRSALVQFPALWWAGVLGRAPLHASALATRAGTPLLVAASGVGRSTLLVRELERGGRATGDNLAVSDGRTVCGLVEPVRVEGGGGRRMPHGRSELAMAGRAEALDPTCVVVLERADSATSALVPCPPERAARALAASTYMAGELRRFWPLAAELAAGTGHGPAHPPVQAVADALADALPCWTLRLGHDRDADVGDLLQREEVAACT
jgi:hypothetical protein